MAHSELHYAILTDGIRLTSDTMSLNKCVLYVIYAAKYSISPLCHRFYRSITKLTYDEIDKFCDYIHLAINKHFITDVKYALDIVDRVLILRNPKCKYAPMIYPKYPDLLAFFRTEYAEEIDNDLKQIISRK